MQATALCSISVTAARSGAAARIMQEKDKVRTRLGMSSLPIENRRGYSRRDANRTGERTLRLSSRRVKRPSAEESTARTANPFSARDGAEGPRLKPWDAW